RHRDGSGVGGVAGGGGVLVLVHRPHVVLVTGGAGGGGARVVESRLGGVAGPVEGVLFDVWQQVEERRAVSPTHGILLRDGQLGVRLREPAEGWGQAAGVVVVIVQSQADLLEVVGRLHASGGLTDLLDCWQQQSNEDGNDGNYDQQLDEREGTTGG